MSNPTIWTLLNILENGFIYKRSLSGLVKMFILSSDSAIFTFP